jgi:hypothetical protein
MAARCPAPAPMWASDAMRPGLLLAVFAAPALAETPLTPAEFAAHIGTDTLTYDYSSGDRGTADYGPNRTLRWAFAGAPCFNGTWFPRDDEICFASEDGTLSACWLFYNRTNGLHGIATFRASGDTAPLEIFEIARTTAPLACDLPHVGV